MRAGRLIAWSAIVAFLSITSYAGRLTGRLDTLPSDAFFRYSTAIITLLADAFLLLLLALIARGLPWRDTFALRPPSSWRLAAAIGAATLVAAYALAFAIVALFPGLAREQSVPTYWDGTRLGAWIANFLVIALFVPIFEEALSRGLGYALLQPLGAPAAVGLTAIAFTLAHGVIVDVPVILATGIGLGVMRAATGSLYACIALHSVFNGFGLVVAALVSR